ncbi:PRC-barrel domain-containing protein [Halomonas sp. ANAO-440]|uniref:PRC-barrel domain-containing protein n=1 Tax=Halomonas sp. ANAO-440 TaxID=2861360 RepID=UPI001CAA61FC|nr:PRC-barrel domain-containing protein [Halomonas sp. ANAO-440]MBZ0330089.1 PRC-barrel domain-containing protein [Halomonas sp. ANAO-440]
MQKHILTIAVAAIAGGLTFGAHAQQDQDASAAQGLYSANDIIGADVYHAADPDEEVGTVENILLDEEGKVAALIVSAGGLWGMGGDDVVVGIEHFTMETHRDDGGIFGQDDVSHRILVNATEDELQTFPEYEEEWFTTERDRRAQEHGDRESAWRTSGTAGTGTVGDGDGMTDDDRDRDDNDAEYTDEDIEDDFD